MQRYKSLFFTLLIPLTGLLPFKTSAQELDPVLKDLIQKGLNKSHSINIYNDDAEQAKIDQKLAKSVFLPKLTFNGSFTRLNDDITFDNDTQNLLTATQKLLVKEAVGLPFNAIFPENMLLTDIKNLQDKNILKSSVDVDWVLFSGFEANNAIKASKHKEASLNYLGMAEKDKVALKIIETYNNLALVYASKKVLTTSETYLNEQEHYVKQAIENGLTTPISRKKIELAQHQLASKKLEFEHNKTLLIEVLHKLTGESREQLSILMPKLESFELNSLSETEKRNEIKALEEAKNASLFKAKMEKNHVIPKIALKGHYEFVEDDLSLLDPQWYVGVGIKWHIFDGNESRLKSKKSLLESEKYNEQLKEAEDMISLSIVKAKLTYEASLQNIKIVLKEIEIADDTYNIVSKQYKNNLASITDVLDAITDVEKAHFKLQESFFKQRNAYTELLHANGTLSNQYN